MKKIDSLKLKLIKTYYKGSLKVKQYSPEILIGVGVAGVVTSTVMACKATTKLSDILEESKEQLDKINTCKEDEEFAKKHGYTQEDAKKDLAIVYTQTGLKVVKLYAPAVALGTVALTCIISSNNILKKRNAALSAAYMTVDRSFKEYRGRVAERFGEEVEKEIRYNIKAEEIVTGKDEEGNDIVETVKTMSMEDPNGYSPYARFFDESCAAWQPDAEYNLMFLKAQQQYANDLLRSRGILFLNEVYDMLGIDRSSAGQIVGWIYDEECPIGDNFVDFGIYDTSKERVRAFVNGYETNILLDFNVDGPVWEQM